jgi:hypothetical protein
MALKAVSEDQRGRKRNRGDNRGDRRAGGRLDSLDVGLDVFPSRDGNQLLRCSKRNKTRVPHPFFRKRVGLSALVRISSHESKKEKKADRSSRKGRGMRQSYKTERVGHPRYLNFIETVAFLEFLCINKKNLAVSVGHPPVI